jgi:dienelactone hydrolase
MAITFECDRCGKSYNIPDELGGKKGQCKKCGQKFVIPHASDSDPYGLKDLAREAEPGPMPAPPPLYRRAPDSGSSPPPVRPPLFPKSKKKSSSKSPLHGPSGYNGDASRHAVWIGIVVVAFVVRVYVKSQMRDPAPQEQPVAQQPAAVALPPPPPRVVNEAQRRAALEPRFAADRDGPIRLPKFPDPGPAREIEAGITLREIRLGPPDPIPGGFPGHCGRLWLYLPAGNHPAKSLPCILIAGAGATLFTGMKLAEGDIPLHLPYVQAGYAVLAFDVDGMLENRQKPSSSEVIQAAHRFQNARAGLVNAHIALEYALAKVPEVDPNRITAAGHSSAGTLALLFTEHEPRIRSCVAYAPVDDIPQEFRKFNMTRTMEALTKEGYGDLFTRYAPRTHEAKLDRPLFLFYALDDAAAPDIAAFGQRLRAAGKPVTVATVSIGGHIESMASDGLPASIHWLQAQEAATGR